MSAFLLDNQWFETLAQEFHLRAMHNGSVLDERYSVSRNVREFLGLDAYSYPNSDNFANTVVPTVRKLYRANVSAIRQRYNDTERYHAPVFEREGYVTQWTTVQLIKALQCLQYQCSEGNVPRTRTYKRLTALIAALCESVVTHTAEYDAAPWG